MITELRYILKGVGALNTYEKLCYCLNQVRAVTDFVPETAIVLGSGLGNYADNINVVCEIKYSDIDGFPVSTAPGHEGKFIFGMLGEKKIVCMKGRIHYYEGYSREDVVLPIRLMKMMGAENLILTNAAGGLNPLFNIGNFMLIRDFVSIFADNPLIGQNINELGVRFPDMSKAYDEGLCNLILKCAKQLGIDIKEGVYAQLTGPSYETPAETRLLRMLGVDAVGMSTVTETIAARHMGMKVCAISCITNMAFDISGSEPNESEVIEAGKRASEQFACLITKLIESIK